MIKLVLFWRWFDICKLINIINHIYDLKDKNHIITSIYAEKAFNKIQHVSFLEKIGLGGTYLNIIKS